MDWVVRRGLCSRCGKTFTFLPPFSPPYPWPLQLHRPQPGALAPASAGRPFLGNLRRPPSKDPDRVADPSTLRRWCQSLDSSQPPFLLLARDDPGCRRRGSPEPRFSCTIRCPCAGTPYSRFIARFWRFADLKRSPAVPTILAWEEGCFPPNLDSGGENSTMAENLERLKQRVPLLEIFCSATTGSLVVPAHARKFVGLVSLTSGNAPLLLRQCRQKPVLLLTRLTAGGGDLIRFVQLFLDLPFRQTVAHLEQELLPRARFSDCWRRRSLLSASTAPPSRSYRLSGTSRSNAIPL